MAAVVDSNGVQAFFKKYGSRYLGAVVAEIIVDDHGLMNAQEGSRVGL